MGLKPIWAIRSEYFSQCSTTHWGELPTAKKMGLYKTAS
ncbi:DUF4113 domain-containing protein [Nodosilinea sp. LEGE 07298]|nr:DUF4113 domain-containing protein [Nodosilinea sp. LEGE 07298]